MGSVTDNAKKVSAKEHRDHSDCLFCPVKSTTAVPVDKDKNVEKALNIRYGVQADADSDGNIDWIRALDAGTTLR